MLRSAVVGFFVLTPAMAQDVTAFMDNQRLLSTCQSNIAYKQGVCDGYIQGVLDATGLGSRPCLPRGVSVQQAHDAVIRELGTYAFIGGAAAARVVMDAWHCR
jgi:Rap1a immunity proteins